MGANYLYENGMVNIHFCLKSWNALNMAYTKYTVLRMNMRNLPTGKPEMRDASYPQTEISKYLQPLSSSATSRDTAPGE